jgi:hypothetical protein
VGLVARMGEARNLYKIFSENFKGTHYSEDFGVGGKIILELILEK